MFCRADIDGNDGAMITTIIESPPRRVVLALRSMPTAGSAATFAAFAFVLVIVPGPSVLFIIGRGVALGPRAALQTVVGNTIGALALVLVVSAGLGPLLDRSDLLFDLIRWSGASYLVYLGVQAIRHRGANSVSDPAESASSSRTHIRDGFVVGLTNPKLAVFLAAVLPSSSTPIAAPPFRSRRSGPSSQWLH